MTFGERIYKLRTEKQMTQDELAAAVGYKSRSTIAKIESGERDCHQSMIALLARALGVTPAYLMGWTDDAIKTHELLKTLHNPENTSEQVKEQDRFIDSIIKGTPIKKDRSAVIERINNLPDDQYEKFAERLEGYLDGLEDQ